LKNLEKEKEKAKREDMMQKRKKKYYESLKRAEAGKYQLLDIKPPICEVF
jgi:hypothetical protein